LSPKGKRSVCLSIAQLFLLVIFFLFESEVFGAEEGSRRYIDEKLQMDLADQFFKEGDYYRAITEYKRFLFFFPQSTEAKEALWKVAKSYFNGKRWDDAISACDELIRKFPGSSPAAEAFLLQGFAFAEKKEYPRARQYFLKAQEVSPDTSIEDEAQLQIALTYVKEEKWKEAADEFRKISKNSRLYPKGEYFAQGLDRIDAVPQKSPQVAGILAAILPGAGHLYCERYRDASIAFLLNGAFIWGMVEAFQHNENVIGGILTFFELGWYSGNVYSAVASAHKYNRKMKQEYIDNLERGLSLGISFQGRSPVFSLRYVF
jgi:TolA-binding protein